VEDGDSEDSAGNGHEGDASQGRGEGLEEFLRELEGEAGGSVVVMVALENSRHDSEPEI
jgi:hypothetical protein